MVAVIPLLFVGVFAVFGVVIVYAAAQNLRTVYHILTNNPIPVRDLETRSGPVEIEGTATVDEGRTVETPFTGTECLAYEYEAQEYRSSGKNSSWRTLEEGGDAVPFVVEDGTGRVRVDPSGAALHFEEHATRVDAGSEPPERIAQYIESTDDIDIQDGTADLVITEVNYGNDQKFVERRLDVDEDVYVYGEADRAAAGGWGSGLVDAVVADGDRTPVFVVSDTSERGTAWRIGKKAVGMGAFGLLWLGLTVLIALVAI